MAGVDLSIILVSFNSREYLRGCLNSIYENTGHSIRYEIFVVDNNSQDQTLKMLQENYPEVRTLDNAENLGFAKANNQALRLAAGRYLLLLNSDTFVLGHALEKMVEYMDQHREAGALAPKLLNEDGQTTQTQGSSWAKRQWASPRARKVNFISGAAFLLRRETYKNVGGLDEHFFFYNEDWDWCKRILKNGWEIHYFPGAAVIHYGGKSTGFLGRRATVEGLRGGLYLAWKHYPLFFPLYRLGLIFFLLLLLLGNIWRAPLRRAAREKIAAYAQVIWIALRWYNEKYYV
ncbi:glycosyl transferase group 2 [Candidatus Termititenax persephonae]|uniref:Glycosyl transferase group 2 n=1 Tax=Candidatus Termititenax persephonae TaxID=2218525 RepID=A0A388TIV7_9BACT|nr:glycosyl transferase group 2 [Candidatus Termititenax persephonae]